MDKHMLYKTIIRSATTTIITNIQMTGLITFLGLSNYVNSTSDRKLHTNIGSLKIAIHARVFYAISLSLSYYIIICNYYYIHDLQNML